LIAAVDAPGLTGEAHRIHSIIMIVSRRAENITVAQLREHGEYV
jgi:hypothetical protein